MAANQQLPNTLYVLVLRQFWRQREMMDGHYDVIDIICFVRLLFRFGVEKPHAFHCCGLLPNIIAWFNINMLTTFLYFVNLR